MAEAEARVEQLRAIASAVNRINLAALACLAAAMAGWRFEPWYVFAVVAIAAAAYTLHALRGLRATMTGDVRIASLKQRVLPWIEVALGVGLVVLRLLAFAGLIASPQW